MPQLAMLMLHFRKLHQRKTTGLWCLLGLSLHLAHVPVSRWVENYMVGSRDRWSEHIRIIVGNAIGGRTGDTSHIYHKAVK